MWDRKVGLFLGFDRVRKLGIELVVAILEPLWCLNGAAGLQPRRRFVGAPAVCSLWIGVGCVGFAEARVCVLVVCFGVHSFRGQLGVAGVRTNGFSIVRA